MPGRRDTAYVRRMTRSPALRIAVALTILAMSAGCAIGGGERVGGEPDADPEVVIVLDPFGAQAITTLASEVSRLSEDRLEIRTVPAENLGADYESATIRDIQDGRADLGLVGTRAWDEFGAPALTALGAPFLVDSYPLQEEVITSGLTEPMLDELQSSGLVGLGILPGPLRRPLGVTGRLAAPDDFQGLTIGTQQSNVADAALRALGAHPERLPLDVTSLDGLGGLEFQVAGIENGRLDADGSHLMTNVNLWPRTLVLFAGDQASDRLSPSQLEILRTAAANVVPEMIAAERALEEEAAANLCRKAHTTFAAATTPELRALRRAVEPVYADLERDAGARTVIEGIEQLKEELGEPPSEIAACSPPSDPQPSGVAIEINGTWTMDTDISAAGPDSLDENWGHWVFVFDRGRFAITQENETSCTWGYGTYAVNGSRTSWTFEDGGGIAPNNAANRPGEHFVFDFSGYRDTLTLAPVEGEISPVNFRAEPWRRVSETASTKHLSTRCPPPPGALDP
jgi:TRAP-type C4-dicarboxylate transport system substrate-binding protein